MRGRAARPSVEGTPALLVHVLAGLHMLCAAAILVAFALVGVEVSGDTPRLAPLALLPLLLLAPLPLALGWGGLRLLQRRDGWRRGLATTDLVVAGVAGWLSHAPLFWPGLAVALVLAAVGALLLTPPVRRWTRG